MRFVSAGLAVAVMLATSCTNTAQQEAAALPPPVKSPPAKSIVSVDPRIELMSVIQLLAGYDHLITYMDHAYKDDARRYFAPCNGHQAVSMFRDMSAKDFNFNAVPDAFVRLSPPPRLEQRYAAMPETIKAAGGQIPYDTFLAAARNFSTTCKFDRFYDSHMATYKAVAEETTPVVTGITGALERYIGKPLGDTRVILAPLLNDGGFAHQYEDEKGRTVAISIIGPQYSEIRKGDPVPLTFGGVDRLDPLITHEFAHTVINPLTAQYADTVAASSSHYAQLAEAMRASGYGNWETVVNESIIRAITIRLTEARLGEDAAKIALADEVKQGFVYVPSLIAVLRQYEADRTLYPTIADIYPKLLDAFTAQPTKY